MFKKLAAIVFILITFGMLVALRFDVPASAHATISDVSNATANHSIHQQLTRGEFIKTGKGEFLDVAIGSSTHVYLDENTTVELQKLFQTDLQIGFTRGRIVVVNHSDTPIVVETNFTKSVVNKNVLVSFVNYDFQSLISIILFQGKVPFSFKDGTNARTITGGTTVREIPPVTFTSASLDLTNGVYASFYHWVALRFDGIMTD